MYKIKSNRGMTLIDLILAIAILGIIIVSFLGAFSFAYSNIHLSGSRSDKILEVQTLIDDLSAQILNDETEVITYLNSKGYNRATSFSDLKVRVGSNEINYYINTTLETKANIDGYEVTILKFLKNKVNSVQITTFVIQGGVK